MNESARKPSVAIIGGGFCGLSAAYDLLNQGIEVTVFEREATVGGLAGSFEVNGVKLEKFYHHWFTNDVHIMDLIRNLGCEDQVLVRPTRTGMFYANSFFKLSKPMDVLRFSPLPFADRLRLGLMALRARWVRDWQSLENRSAADWLRDMGGERVYRVVWEPLLRGKFGSVAEDVSAVWFWNKLKLRGSSRGKGAEEQLAYYKGGFDALAQNLAKAIAAKGGTILTDTEVRGLDVSSGKVVGVRLGNGDTIPTDAVIATPALPIIAELVLPHVDKSFVDHLRRIRYLANVCIVLELDRSLSGIYWLNVNDPSFPFVGVIEHTNFEPASTYHGRHVVYLSKYLEETDSLYTMEDGDIVQFTLSHLKRMFPDFDETWVLDAHVWRAQFSQPIVERGYRHLIPADRTPLDGFFIATMAQIYPEDRGTNYAVRQGRQIAGVVARELVE